MQLDTLISPDEAKARLAEYEQQLHSERTTEDDAIRRGYKAAARGLPVVHLPTVIEAGGRFPNGLPRLAVVRAAAAECWVRVNSWRRSGNDVITYTDRSPWDDHGHAAVGAYRVEVSVPRPAVVDNPERDGRTVVPLVPPQHRPARNRLHLFHILWEVEQWDPTPPVDPALLRHLRGDLWTVHATWDLTELERAVLAGRVS